MSTQLSRQETRSEPSISYSQSDSSDDCNPAGHCSDDSLIKVTVKKQKRATKAKKVPRSGLTPKTIEDRNEDVTHHVLYGRAKKPTKKRQNDDVEDGKIVAPLKKKRVLPAGLSLWSKAISAYRKENPKWKPPVRSNTDEHKRIKEIHESMKTQGMPYKPEEVLRKVEELTADRIIKQVLDKEEMKEKAMQLKKRMAIADENTRDMEEHDLLTQPPTPIRYDSPSPPPESPPTSPIPSEINIDVRDFPKRGT